MLPTQGRTTTGFTASERYLAALCERSFLSLWSHPNLFRSKAKELTDLLVVFGDDIIIFSDKCCEFGAGDIKVSWPRWYKKAVIKSAHQLHRAEGWLRNHPERVFLNSKATEKFPIPINPNARIHLIAVAIGASQACVSQFGDSGSMMIASDKPGELFTVGDLDSQKTFVHVFDDVTLDLIFSELDTISDFIAYLARKETLFRTKLVISDGEEDLLAYYLSKIAADGRHGFPFDELIDVAYFGPLWSKYRDSPERRERQRADQTSYLWDKLIEHVAFNAMNKTLLWGSDRLLEEHEFALRRIAAEPRLHRRGLAMALIAVGETEPTKNFFARTLPAYRDSPTYLFLKLANLGGDYDQYREHRRKILHAYADVVRMRDDKVVELIGIAFDSFQQNDGSVDVLWQEFSNWTEDDTERAQHNSSVLKLSEPSQLRKVHFHQEEYPTAAAHKWRPIREKAKRAKRKVKRKAQTKGRKVNMKRK